MFERFPLNEDLITNRLEQDDIMFNDADALFEAFDPKFLFTSHTNKIYVGQTACDMFFTHIGSDEFSRHGFGLAMCYVKCSKTFIFQRGLFRNNEFLYGQ